MGVPLEVLRQGIWNPQWKKKKQRDFVSNSVEFEDEHPRLSSDIHMCATAYVYPDALTTLVNVQTELFTRLSGVVLAYNVQGCGLNT